MGYVKREVQVFNLSKSGGVDYDKVICPLSGDEVWVFPKNHNKYSTHENKTPQELAGKGCRWGGDPKDEHNCPYHVYAFGEKDGKRYKGCKIPEDKLQMKLI